MKTSPRRPITDNLDAVRWGLGPFSVRSPSKWRKVGRTRLTLSWPARGATGGRLAALATALTSGFLVLRRTLLDIAASGRDIAIGLGMNWEGVVLVQLITAQRIKTV